MLRGRLEALRASGLTAAQELVMQAASPLRRRRPSAALGAAGRRAARVMRSGASPTASRGFFATPPREPTLAGTWCASWQRRSPDPSTARRARL